MCGRHRRILRPRSSRWSGDRSGTAPSKRKATLAPHACSWIFSDRWILATPCRFLAKIDGSFERASLLRLRSHPATHARDQAYYMQRTHSLLKSMKMKYIVAVQVGLTCAL